MNILVIDTSTELEFLALSADGKIFQYCSNEGISHSVTMFRNLSDLLARASIGINDIDLIGTGIGPGSFTGIRIAVSTARMFSQILKVPLVGLKSQELYAASARSSEDKTVMVAFDAKKSKVFAGVYRVKDSISSEVVGPGDYTIDELTEQIKTPGELICIGDGCGKYIDAIEKKTREKGIVCRYIDNFCPDGEAAAELTLGLYRTSPERYLDFNNTVPFYTRKSDAEIAMENSRKQ